ncbi:DctP family TRAP transporter solute-binding subunit [Rhodoferax saidenbachensis]|uniref:C4-dicarboxylate-binding protein DctP n=1 Tax=Rhodoferax saidenbachensis TaxID=1484693 RepID=A0ABU1ZSE7_9BURK|nr:DctP family TRAP transporter solute-binding subunit [Rhodoferax saidenbachensis]MDR7307471.1 C4-dicarboxylate-binding protein DctP [Rhodoferax saidenbachensis]
MPALLPPADLRRRQWLQTAVSLAAAAMPLRGRAAAGTTIRLSHVVAQDTPKGMALERFRTLVEERTAQRIRVQIFPQGRLYGDQDEMQALQLGAIDMVAPSLSKFGPIGFPEFELFDLPFLFNSVTDVRHITQGPVGQRLLNGLSRQRLLGLGYFDNGFKHMSANHALLEPAHFAGLRMRVQSSRVIAQQMRALGAWPITLPFSETRRALETGVVDGTENPVSNFYTQGMQAVQSDLSLTEHGYLGYAVVAHQRFWLGLPAADRTLVQDALREALAFGNDIADAHNDKALAALHVTGAVRIHTPTAAQRLRFKAAVMPVHADLARRIGQPWLDAVREALPPA